MSSTHLSDELRGFLSGRISTADQIEIIVLLLKNPDRTWSAPEVAETLRMAPESTAMRLFLLASNGLIVFEPSGVPRYRYAAVSETSDRLMHELVDAYNTRRAAVLDAIGASPRPVDPVQSFADAFKLKK